MKWLRDLDLYLEENRIFFKREESLANYTTIKIGGKALRTLYPENREKLFKILKFLDEGAIPYFVMGGGSNLLVADDGFDGVVIMMKDLSGIEECREYKESEELVLKVLSGTRINSLIRYGYERGYGGFEFLAGVPATLGGAIRMNAGAFGNSTSLFVKKIELYKDKEIQEIIPTERDWTYRSFKIDGVIISAEVKLKKLEKDEIKKTLREVWTKRRLTQPISERTFGSVFKNPPCCYAGALIEQVGLKGYKLRGAKISEKHANFIVNIGNATCKEVIELIKLAQKKVWERFNILLEPEVKFLGINYEGLA